jgi:hypothetical protein
MMRSHVAACLGVWAALVGCAGDGTGPGAGMLPYRTKVTATKTDAAQQVASPSVLYVSDFDLDIAPPSSPQQGILPGNGPVRSVLGELRGESQDPAEKARQLVALMSRTIVEDLTEKNFVAQRLLPGQPTPTEGWLVRGVFTEIDEGNRLRKAVVGFGAGKSQLDLYVNLTDLSQGVGQPFYRFEASNNSGNMPGGAVMKMNPYAMAAKFVISRSADEKQVTHTAETIAEQISEKLRPAATSAGAR